jgi:hypothetical protein
MTGHPRPDVRLRALAGHAVLGQKQKLVEAKRDPDPEVCEFARVCRRKSW